MMWTFGQLTCCWFKRNQFKSAVRELDPWVSQLMVRKFRVKGNTLSLVNLLPGLPAWCQHGTLWVSRKNKTKHAIGETAECAFKYLVCKWRLQWVRVCVLEHRYTRRMKMLQNFPFPKLIFIFVLLFFFFKVLDLKMWFFLFGAYSPHCVLVVNSIENGAKRQFPSIFIYNAVNKNNPTKLRPLRESFLLIWVHVSIDASLSARTQERVRKPFSLVLQAPIRKKEIRWRSRKAFLDVRTTSETD